MKKILIHIIFLLPLIIITGCEALPPLESEGKIFEFDYRRCACCGGVFIEIEGDTLRIPVISDEFYRDLTADNLPWLVELNWEPEAEPCLGDEIIVHRIKRI